MIEKEIQFRKKRELGDIITDSFEFIKQEYKPISKLVLTYVLPFIILYAFVQINMQKKIIGNIDLSDTESLLANLGPIYGNLLIASLFGIFVQSLLAGVFYSYIEIYIKKGKGNFELSEITSLLFSNGLLALGANIFFFIIVMFGVIMCIIPGIYFANTFSIVVMIFIFEKKGLSNALTRSWNLVQSQWWNTLLINLLGIIFVWVIGFVLSIPAMLSGVGNGMQTTLETGAVEQPYSYWILIGITTVASSLLWIIPYTFLALQYFNLDEQTKTESSVQNNME